MSELNQRSSRRARKQGWLKFNEFINYIYLVNYADPPVKMRRGDAICANSLVQSFSPKTTGRKKRTIKKPKK